MSKTFEEYQFAIKSNYNAPRGEKPAEQLPPTKWQLIWKIIEVSSDQRKAVYWEPLPGLFSDQDKDRLERFKRMHDFKLQNTSNID